jgi:UDP-glucose:(heptosyl)LPS alpha-1,3-glucosyltransferase
MRLAIIRRRYNPYGGAERFIERVTARLTKRAIETTIIAEDWSGSDKVFGNKHIEVKCSGLSRTSRFVSFQKSVRAVLDHEAAAGRGFDLIQSHERVTGVDIFRLGDGVHAAWVRRLQQESRGLRSLLLNMDSYHRAVIDTERAMARDSKLHYVANSSLVVNELQEYWSVPDSRITLIPNGVDTSFFSPATPIQKEESRQALAKQHSVGITPETLIITVVGSGFSRKGIFQLIEACAKVKNYVLLICGEDKAAGKAKTLIKHLGVESRIALTGPLEDVRPLLWAADIFALPSLYDPSSNAVLEALACGVPVIVTRDVGMAWEITDTDAGTICDRSVASILLALRKCADAGRRQHMAYQARAFALRYDQSQIIEQWLEFYRTMRAQR